MTVAAMLLKARRIGVRKFRNHVFLLVRQNSPLVITEHGEPTSVVVPYEDMLEIADVLDELQDEKTLKAVAEGRKAIRRGVKGILASKILNCKE